MYKQIALLSLSALLLSGCKLAQTNSLVDEYDFYSEQLGLAFNYANSSTSSEPEISKNSVKINYRIESYKKPAEQDITDFILSLIEELGKDSDNCIVSGPETSYLNQNYNVYSVDLANQNIPYTTEEQARITKADSDTARDGGPFDGDYMKNVILNERRVELCSHLADQAGKGGGLTFNNSQRLIWQEGMIDAPAYDPESVTLFD